MFNVMDKSIAFFRTSKKLVVAVTVTNETISEIPKKIYLFI